MGGEIPPRKVCSSSGLGHRPFTAATGVRISYRSLCGKPEVKAYFLDAYEI